MSFQNLYVNSQDQNTCEIVSGCKPQKEHFISMQQKQTVATRSTKHNKPFQPITNKKALGVGFGGVIADEEEGGVYLDSSLCFV